MRRFILACAGCLVFAAFAFAAKEAKMLFDFEDAGDLAKWEAAEADVSIVGDHATSGKSALKVTLKAAEYPGITTTQAPNDWKGFAKLSFDLFADEDMTLLVRIDDENSKDYASRYNNDGIDIKKGANNVSIELADVGDKIDLAKVKMLILFGSNPPKPVTFYLDNVRLEK
jgi:hypothetical protein